MDFNNVTKGKAIPLGIIIIVLTYLLSGASSSILREEYFFINQKYILLF